MPYKKAEENFQTFIGWARNKLGFPRQHKKAHPDGTQEKFAKLPSEARLELLKPQLDFYTSSVSRKTEMLPTLATLAAALIVVATLNPSVVPLSSTDTRIILSLFMLLIPITLHYYIKLMERVARGASEIIASYQGKDPFRNIERTFFIGQLESDFPIIVVYIFYGVIFLIFFRMWRG